MLELELARGEHSRASYTDRRRSVRWCGGESLSALRWLDQAQS